MSNYKIHIDKPLPDPAQIERHKDFGALYGKYRGMRRFEFWRNLYRKPTYFAAVVAILAIGYLVVESTLSTEAETPAFVQAPLSTLDIPFVSSQWESPEDELAGLTSGAQIQLPEAAFVDSSGETVTGKIELRYREITETLGIFTAGIPLQLDTAKNGQQLAPETMIEILAYQDGEPVFLREGVRLEVSYLASEEIAPLNHYFLDTVAGNWVLKGQDEVVESAGKSNAIPPRPKRPELLTVRDSNADTLISKGVDIPPRRPGKPFKVKIGNLTDFPEMRGYENVYWEKIRDTHANDPNREQIAWGNATARRYSDRYVLRFTRNDANGRKYERVVEARPMFRAGSRSDAERIYREQYAAYETALAAYEARKQAAAQARAQEEALESERIAAEEAYQEALREWEEHYGQDAREIRYERRLKISRLGIHTLANPVSALEEQQTIRLQWPEDGPGANAKSSLYVLPYDEKTIWKVPANESGEFSLPLQPEKIKAFWLVSEEGKLASIQSTGLNQGNATFSAEWVESPKDIAALRQILGL